MSVYLFIEIEPIMSDDVSDEPQSICGGPFWAKMRQFVGGRGDFLTIDFYEVGEDFTLVTIRYHKY